MERRSRLFAVGNSVFFAANDGTHGVELWKSDGTVEGTVLIKDILPGSSIPNSSNDTVANEAIAFHDQLFFTANDGEHGTELWKSDGTEAGTTLVSDVNPSMIGTIFAAPGSSLLPATGTNLDGSLYFVGSDPTRGSELWTSDGTVEGTTIVRDINPNGGALGIDRAPVNVNGTLFLSPYDGVRFGLWKSDGTEEGTVLVKNTGGAEYLTDVNGTLLFSSQGGLWRSDGTNQGTVRVYGLPRQANLQAHLLTEVNGNLYFASCCDGNPGAVNGLWISDGTQAGTVHLTNNDDGVGSITNVNGTALFSLFDSASGEGALWKSDGTKSGTVLVKDVSLSGDGSTAVGQTLFFTADDGSHGTETWKSNGTTDGTVLVKDIQAGATGSTPTDFFSAEGKLYFFADDGTHGPELWTSDGTDAGTFMVKDIAPGSSGSSPLFFNDFFTDGIHVNSFAVHDGKVYFGADDGTHGAELWQSDGTSEGTVMVADLNSGPGGSSVQNLIDVDGKLFFNADDGIHGRGLWVLQSDVEPLPGDADGNGKVDFADFTILAANFGRNEDLSFGDGDFDADGRVAFSDFLILADNYGRSVTPPPVALVAATTAHFQAVDLVLAEPLGTATTYP